MNATDAERHAWLCAEIERHNRLYYDGGTPEISDKEFDRLYDELLRLETDHPEFKGSTSPTQRVGSKPLQGFRRIRHALPMLSLEKAEDAEKLRLFDARVRKRLGGEKVSYVVEPKLDGVSISVRYEDGQLVLAATRGDGTEGDDITANAKTIRSLPHSLLTTIPPAVLEARGEVLMHNTDFEAFNRRLEEAGEKPFLNARNGTAGSLKLLDPSAVVQRPLRVIFYALGECDGIAPTTHWEAVEQLAQLGLPVVGTRRRCASVEEILSFAAEFKNSKASLPYETDGLVVKVDRLDQWERLPSTLKTPGYAIAFKPADWVPQVETVLKAITVQVGRTGVLTPVAELEPVPLAGSVIARATLHNEDDIRRKDVRIGDTVIIEKAGSVIPAVVSVVHEKRPSDTRPFDLLEHIGGCCPVCGGTVEKDPEFVVWRCINLHCPAQSMRRLEHFARRAALDISSLGGVVADSLVESGLVREPLDLFSLQLEQLASLNLGTPDEPRVFGAKNASKVLDALERSRTAPLSRWLTALAIPELGETTARDLAACHGTMDEVANSPLLQDIVALNEAFATAEKKNPNTHANKKLPPEEASANRALFERAAAQVADCGDHLVQAGLAEEREVTLGGRVRKFVTAIGPVTAGAILSFFASDRGKNLLEKLRVLGINPCSEMAPARQGGGRPFDGQSFVITGTLSQPRGVFEERIRQLGGRTASSVSAKTTFLLAGEEAGSKLDKALQLSVQVLSEVEFEKLARGESLP